MKEFNIEDFRGANLPNEGEVMSGWKGDNPLVSIVCTTYNHEKYIEDAIRGFLTQKTDFPFEIIIHDDASTDGTRSIVRQYAERYPSLIIPIFQKENQFSKGRRVIPIATGFAKGKYCALCEGDDFWIDGGKLQKQITIMEQKQDYRISFHPCFKGYPEAGKKVFRRKMKDFFLYPHRLNVFSVRSVILGDGGGMPTASLVIRTDVFSGLPECFYGFPLGDYFLQIIASSPAGAIYIPSAMSFYRVSSKGSWSSKLSDGYEHKLKHWLSMREAVRALDESMDGEYAESFKKYMSWCEVYFFADYKVPKRIRVNMACQQKDLSNAVVRGVRYLSACRILGEAYFLLLVQKARMERYLYFSIRSFFVFWFGVSLLRFE